ncbi:hypothetical protein C488_14557 [Natrinema pellirubrum DSM 15624]|uniref:DUF7509 domain-containing protein n=1 Tax=Natrinema pellirubrum (strain DSM 15624 / CIP 106293 / JCM 10476 / NCIMB 786 / 157) TaxID=797303 RepID=L0JMU3_NATP1|nr:hypothetical protein [Natrinema pellirubrum]AGB31696.1 hypothetical protein Natpe_1819 [Natrinema pellirubrum DSM 15624]ELY72910.1 hypothetical protein C488_14557 [Natrinema pellirubrum DSM 15624]
MRERLFEALDESEYIQHDASKSDFLVYLMGPYKSYPPYESPTPEETDVATSRPTLNEITRRLQRGELTLDQDEALALLISLKRDLREQNGVNAFLATDPQIPLDEMDAATQSIEYTKAATATVFIAPAMGDNLGVGIEIGSVCEHLDQPELLTDVAFYGEENVESAMIKAVSERWHVTIDDFRSYEDLYKAIRAHLRAVA